MIHVREEERDIPPKDTVQSSLQAATIQRLSVLATPGFRGLSQTPNRGDGPC